MTVAHGVPVIVRIAGAIDHCPRHVWKAGPGKQARKDRHRRALCRNRSARTKSRSCRAKPYRFPEERVSAAVLQDTLAHRGLNEFSWALRCCDDQIADHRSRENHPPIGSARSTSLQLHRLDMEALFREELTPRRLHGGLRFGRGGWPGARRSRRNSDAQARQFQHARTRAPGYNPRRGVRREVRPCHHFEEWARTAVPVCRHRPHHANPRESACPRREKSSRGWNPAGVGLSPQIPGKNERAARMNRRHRCSLAHGTARLAIARHRRRLERLRICISQGWEVFPETAILSVSVAIRNSRACWYGLAGLLRRIPGGPRAVASARRHVVLRRASRPGRASRRHQYTTSP